MSNNISPPRRCEVRCNGLYCDGAGGNYNYVFKAFFSENSSIEFIYPWLNLYMEWKDSWMAELHGVSLRFHFLKPSIHPHDLSLIIIISIQKYSYNR